MKPASDAVAQAVNANVHKDVVQSKSDKTTFQPKFESEKKIDVKSDTVNVNHNQVVQMKRVNHPTPIQLIDENGMPEA